MLLTLYLSTPTNQHHDVSIGERFCQTWYPYAADTVDYHNGNPFKHNRPLVGVMDMDSCIIHLSLLGVCVLRIRPDGFQQSKIRCHRIGNISLT